VELVRPGPGKGDAVAALATERELRTVLVAGDDVADLEAFTWARTAMPQSVLVGVVSEEAPPALGELSDILVSSPAELVGLLQKLTA
jgi:trehalose-6-phosphatase